MKILKILGLVLLLHALALPLVMGPGCRSTRAGAETASASPAAAVPAPAQPVALAPTAVPEPQPISLNLTMAQTGAPGRFSPTRPGAVPEELAVVPAKTYEVRKGDSLGSIARKHGLTDKELAAANNLSKTSILRIGQKLIIPVHGAKPAAATSPQGVNAALGADNHTYTVKMGDTLGKIATRAGTTSAALRALNGLSGDMLKVGQVLQLPTNAKVPAVVGVGSGSVAATISTVPSTPVPAGAGVHTVALGDSAEAIARKYKITVGELARANNLTDPRKLRAGQRLIIPGPAGANAAPPAPSLVPDSPPPVPAPIPAPDAGLPASAGDAPVIKVEEPPTAPATPVN